tara:strand:- start:1681 stop:1899 length:219 start_codon:yes stop_codon:yes gene_type:complete
MSKEEKEWFLSLPKGMKLHLLDDMMKEGQTGMALATMKILLDAPITKGGISTDEIKEVMDMNIAKLGKSKNN